VIAPSEVAEIIKQQNEVIADMWQAATAFKLNPRMVGSLKKDTIPRLTRLLDEPLPLPRWWPPDDDDEPGTES
jgi:hypothetical protein